MSRVLSNALRAQLNAQDSNDPLLTLVTITHPDMVEPIRLVNNTEDITSNGHLYSAFSFTCGLPNDDGESIKQVQLNVDNTSLEFISTIRSITTPMSVNIDFILVSIPDIIQFSLEDLEVRSVAYDISSMRFILTVDDNMNVSLTSEEYNPATYPGLF